MSDSRAISAPRFWALIFVMTALFLVVSDDGRHHWHEFRHLHAAAHYTPGELMDGAFDPGPAPVAPPERVADWYATKLSFSALLREVVKFIGPGVDGYRVIRAIPAVFMVLGAVFFALGISRRLGSSRGSTPLLIMALLLFSPAGLYLSFKLLPETLAFLAAGAALFLLSLRSRSVKLDLVTAVGFGTVLGVASLADWKLPVVVWSLWIIAVLMGRSVGRPERWWRDAVGWGCYALTLWIGLHLLGTSPGEYARSITGAFQFSKDLPTWIFALFSLSASAGLVWILLPFASLSDRPRDRRFLLVWSCVTLAVLIVASWNFLEPRHLIGAMVPLAALAALAVEAVSRRWSESFEFPGGRVAVEVLVLLAVASSSVWLQRYLPYEMDEHGLLDAAALASAEGSPVLLPWNYTDYHFLRFLYPSRPIYLVQSPARVDGSLIDDPVWTEKRRRTYGDWYLPSSEALSRVMEDTAFYIGWTVLPSLENLRRDVVTLGLDKAGRLLRPDLFLDHMTQSWLWNDPGYTLTQVATFGQYKVFLVRRRLEGNATSGRVEPDAGRSRPERLTETDAPDGV